MVKDISEKILNDEINIFMNNDLIKLIYDKKKYFFKRNDKIEIFKRVYELIEETNESFDTDFVFDSGNYDISTFKIREILYE